jgi:hypothetical protein
MLLLSACSKVLIVLQGQGNGSEKLGESGQTVSP